MTPTANQPVFSSHPDLTNSRGFTLLELILVLFILSLLSTLAWSSLGHLDNEARRRETLVTMEKIRDAIMGPSGVYDAEGQRVIGGYVGDMKKFPDLWEPRAEVKPSFQGTSWPNPDAGLGQGPDFEMNPEFVFFRPSGEFANKRFQWLRPYRRLTNDTDTHQDHIGGLETENEGQPRGLWTYYTEDLPYDLPGHAAPGTVEGEDWNGPYIKAPVKGDARAGEHLAGTALEYAKLEPVWIPSDKHETWEDGDYDATLGEHFDDKENFRQLNVAGRFADGWGRALKFFITEDPDREGSRIFWILSEGPDLEAHYPAKGTCSDFLWSVDAEDTMGKNYDETLDENQDNIVMKIFSHEYETVFEREREAKEAQTQILLDQVRMALIGEAPAGNNTGYTGDMTALPGLFQWEESTWDNEDDAGNAYTKGQPRGLWTRSPNLVDTGDDLTASAWGLGWRTAYLGVPQGSGENQLIRDAWGRDLLFFHDAASGAMLVLCRGADGMFDFGTVSTDHTKPENLVEAIDADSYDPNLETNPDNLMLVIREYEFSPGYLAIGRLVVLNATAAATKARLFISGTAAGDALLTCTTLTDEDGDGALDDWGIGTWPGAPALEYSDTSADTLPTGTRYLVIWNDTDNDSEIDTGETFKTIRFAVKALPGSGEYERIRVDTAVFQTF